MMCHHAMRGIPANDTLLPVMARHAGRTVPALTRDTGAAGIPAPNILDRFAVAERKS